VAAIKKAQEALLNALKTERKKEMAELDKGDKPTDAMIKLIVDTANEVMQGYRAETVESSK
jgi:hypothetical protein